VCVCERVSEGCKGWGVSRGAWRVERRDSVERLVNGYNIIGRCGFGVVEVLMWYGREVLGVEVVVGVEWGR